MGFDPCNHVLKIRESFWDYNMGVHLGVWGFIPSHSLHSQEHVKWLLGLPLNLPPSNPLPWSQAQG
jgi:hypothetical protein